ncbi:DUF4468 domain-containing protein [Hymenobacter terrenus]|uniref:DUF4468 domain-containing protein n=1 Tax=Hymenobacter terrenus TaxID=1629124 RepID=UPI00061938AE|nr:DUF4468 domain-containing protein [Hymenobacter terrenus]
MKILLLVAFLSCAAGNTMGQAAASFPIDKVTRRICYTAVVPAAGVSQVDLRARARAWASSITSADKPAIETNEQDTEVVIVYGVQPFAYTYETAESTTRLPRHYTINMVLHYTAKLSLREGRYRYEVTDFVLEHPLAKPPSPTRWPAEDDLIKARALNEDGTNSLTAERKSFATSAAKLQVQLREKMNTPIITSEAK